jgi:peptide deformylase
VDCYDAIRGLGLAHRLILELGNIFNNRDSLITLLDNSYIALLPVLCYSDPRLHRIAKPVAAVDARIKKIVADMADTMYEAPGVGLAATQVDIHERIVVIDI